MQIQTKERLIDKLRDDLYKKHSWTGRTAVHFMVPLILSIRYVDAQLVTKGTPAAAAMDNALRSLQQGGKRELETVLNRISSQYHALSPLLQNTLNQMIHFVVQQPDGVIYDVLDYLQRNNDLLNALRDEDFIGTLFERSVSDAFRGDDGRFFTPRTVILIVREMLRLLLVKRDSARPLSSYTVCDPCCGSARFLVHWSESILHEIRSKQPAIPQVELLASLKEIAQHKFFGADIHDETAVYACLNMLLHGDGATNIAAHDSLDHFGFFADIPLLKKFAVEFEAKWASYRDGPVSRRSDLADYLSSVDAHRKAITKLQQSETIDLSSPNVLVIPKAIRDFLYLNSYYACNWDTVAEMQRRFKRQPVFETMAKDWAQRNPDVASGLDIIITNPPFGRHPTLMSSRSRFYRV